MAPTTALCLPLVLRLNLLLPLNLLSTIMMSSPGLAPQSRLVMFHHHTLNCSLQPTKVRLSAHTIPGQTFALRLDEKPGLMSVEENLEREVDQAWECRQTLPLPVTDYHPRLCDLFSYQTIFWTVGRIGEDNTGDGVMPSIVARALELTTNLDPSKDFEVDSHSCFQALGSYEDYVTLQLDDAWTDSSRTNCLYALGVLCLISLVLCEQAPGALAPSLLLLGTKEREWLQIQKIPKDPNCPVPVQDDPELKRFIDAAYSRALPSPAESGRVQYSLVGVQWDSSTCQSRVQQVSGPTGVLLVQWTVQLDSGSNQTV
ncbi:hypothetical protein DFP72DRAFT_859161 [Ephemerocybe angulata]|uniref:Uncharacterized protein n=1 Tax=Ephemerocybe angulata TaxID=980116 RepID=A0A8H6HCG7_9AGAR|nr:hypothetical protein DFP72DRAFT_859161 [Tulosesus angulatus]